MDRCLLKRSGQSILLTVFGRFEARTHPLAEQRQQTQLKHNETGLKSESFIVAPAGRRPPLRLRCTALQSAPRRGKTRTLT